MAVKVFDASGSKSSEYLLNTLAKYSMYSFYHVDAKGMTEKTVEENAKKTASTSNLFTALYIKEDFEEQLLAGNVEDAFTVYITTGDQRARLLQTNSTEILSDMQNMAVAAGSDSSKLYAVLEQSASTEIQKHITTISSGDSVDLTEKQKNQKSSFGYVLAFFSLSFLLSGVFISSIYVKERNNNVLKRITLTKASFFNYISVKIVMAVITLVFEEIVICIGLSLLGNSLGLSTLQFVFSTSGVGIVLLLLSIAIGNYTNSVVTVAFSGFFAWTISNCLSGLYFPISHSSVWMQAIARLMPQYWCMKLYDNMITGVSSYNLLYVGITLTFLLFITCIGILGLRLTSKR